VTDPREMAFRDMRRDDPARFLRELRELRIQAGLGHAELAARAHYPCDAIKVAEAGPALPDLPVLSAYVRGCGGTLADWEERWRAITGCPASPLLTTRESGSSEAADAGARVGAVSAFSAFSDVSADSDGQDADRVMAALNRVADGSATVGPVAPAAPVVSALSGLAEYVAPDPAQAAPGAARIAADVWTRVVPANSAPTAAPPPAAHSDVTPAPPATANGGPAATRAATAGGAPTAGPSGGAHRSGAVTFATRPADRSRGPLGSRKALAAAAVVALLLVVTLLAVFA
jgi:hypothetical protein